MTARAHWMLLMRRERDHDPHSTNEHDPTTQHFRKELFMTLSKRLSPISLEDSASGNRIELGTLWEDQTTVLIFLRHFG
jgi:hypothetical protein